jgi:DNA recombination protein RmuC
MVEIILLGAIFIAVIIFGIVLMSAIKKLTFSNPQTFLSAEFEQNRNEIAKTSKDARLELQTSLNSLRQEMQKTILDFTDRVNKNFEMTREKSEKNLNDIQFDVQKNFNAQRQDMQKTILDFTEHINQNFEKVRTSVENKLKDIQNDNAAKIEQMRQTVDEKLHKTLETRLGESFKLVSQRLEDVHRGLGQMQELASGVGDLKRVLSNVKTKGVLGEYQLAAILEQFMPPSGYASNIKVNPDSNDMVEFAVRYPGEADGSYIYLPIDAKFPTVNYERLLDAYEQGNPETIKECQKLLASTIKKCAQDIKSKYICPPHTTDFAVMYLPFEGLYAEVLRIPGLFSQIANEYKVTINGPTTLSAFLNSIQVIFRKMAIEKRAGEIWNLLLDVKTEFGKFGAVLEKAKSKIESAGREIDSIGVRSRAIDRRLNKAQELPQAKDDGLAQLKPASETEIEKETENDKDTQGLF